jgi:hypothetical protein
MAKQTGKLKTDKPTRYEPIKANIKIIGISNVAFIISGPAALLASLKALDISVPAAAFA